MSLLLKKGVKFLAYGTLLAVGLVLTFLFGRQGGEHSIMHGGITAPVAYADVPYAGDGGDSAGDGGGGSSGDGDCGGDGDGDDGY